MSLSGLSIYSFLLIVKYDLQQSYRDNVTAMLTLRLTQPYRHDIEYTNVDPSSVDTSRIRTPYNRSSARRDNDPADILLKNHHKNDDRFIWYIRLTNALWTRFCTATIGRIARVALMTRRFAIRWLKLTFRTMFACTASLIVIGASRTYSYYVLFWFQHIYKHERLTAFVIVDNDRSAIAKECFVQ